jgi:predicted dehydrogenase
MKPVRIVVVGVGSFGRMHARTLAGLAEADLAGVVDADPRSIQLLRESLPQVRAWDRLEDALRASNAEAYVVATRTESHVETARAVLAAGSAVLIEKPLANSLSAARSLQSLVKPDSTNLMMGHVVLFAPEFRQLIRESSNRGPIVHFHAVRHRPAKTAERFPEENPIRMTMVHDLYLALALTGGADPTKMFARLHRPGGAGAILALAEIEWGPQTWGSFTASFLTPPGLPVDGFDRFELFGDGWAARLSLNPQPLELWTDRAQWPLTLNIHDDINAPSGWLADELRCFCRVVRGDAPVPVGARYQDAMMIQDWIEQLEGSAAEQSAARK